MDIRITKQQLISKLKNEEEITVRDNDNYLYTFNLNSINKNIVKFKRIYIAYGTVFRLDARVDYNGLLSNTVMFNSVDI